MMNVKMPRRETRGTTRQKNEQMVRVQRTLQMPIRTDGARKEDVRTQFAALCWRERKGEVQVLLVTSRDSGRWVLPKGWPIDGLTPAEAALREAWEEAGVRGRASEVVAGLFSYRKAMDDEDWLPCVVAVFPVEVKDLAGTYPESEERRRKWFAPKKAAQKVREPELREILRRFVPPRTRH
jgi:8-oxo-dGTP pyrophosphatase MutT (NUDIX family)